MRKSNKLCKENLFWVSLFHGHELNCEYSLDFLPNKWAILTKLLGKIYPTLIRPVPCTRFLFCFTFYWVTPRAVNCWVKVTQLLDKTCPTMICPVTFAQHILQCNSFKTYPARRTCIISETIFIKIIGKCRGTGNSRGEWRKSRSQT